MQLNSPRAAVLLVGCSKYLDPGLLDITHVNENLRTLPEVLRDAHDGQFWAEVTVVKDPQRPVDITRNLRALCDRDDIDIILFYFVGHGILDEQLQLHLATVETDLAAVPETALPYRLIRRLVAESRSTARLVLLDCCFSGLALSVGLAAADSVATGQDAIGGTFTITSSGKTVPSIAPSWMSMTAFTNAICAVLDGSAGEPWRELTATGMADEVREWLSLHGFPSPKVRVDDAAGDIVVRPARSASLFGAKGPERRYYNSVAEAVTQLLEQDAPTMQVRHKRVEWRSLEATKDRALGRGLIREGNTQAPYSWCTFRLCSDHIPHTELNCVGLRIFCCYAEPANNTVFRNVIRESSTDHSGTRGALLITRRLALPEKYWFSVYDSDVMADEFDYFIDRGPRMWFRESGKEGLPVNYACGFSFDDGFGPNRKNLADALRILIHWRLPSRWL